MVENKLCPRVQIRMVCDECGYPESEALVNTDHRLPHLELNTEEEVKEVIKKYFKIITKA